jgi:hypothetical protein
VRLSNLADLFGVSVDTVSRHLRGLEPTWIECDVGAGQRAWKIRLTGLASPPKPVEAPHDLRTSSAPEDPFLRRLTSAAAAPDDGANPHGEPDSVASEPPQDEAASGHTRPDPTVGC